MVIDRVILMVLDSVGIGALPDAGLYGDEGSNTIGNIARKHKGFALPNMVKAGLGNIDADLSIGQSPQPTAAYGKAMEVSPGKDTTTGHWEISGLNLKYPFPMYPEGFPADVIDAFEQVTHKKALANKPASGTQIIDEFGEEHLQTGNPIVYTSADSVFQIAAHEEVIPVDELYEICRQARVILTDEHAVGRVIARPFIGTPGEFRRTTNRKDFSLDPLEDTVLDKICEAGKEVIAVGKINDIFCGKGISRAVKTADNMEGISRTIDLIRDDRSPGLIFTNLVDFDMIYGHRNDVEGYATALMAFDERLPQIMEVMREQDVLILTADHGCDPTTPGSDHSREYIPILVYGKPITAGTDLGTRRSFADIGATIAEMLHTAPTAFGESFYHLIGKPA